MTLAQLKFCENDTIGMAIQTIREVETFCKAPLTYDAVELITKAEAPGTENASITCIVCNIGGQVESAELEKHHVAGRSNYETLMIPVCLRHHQHLSVMQLKWLIQEISPSNQLASYFFGLSDLFYLLWEETRLVYFQELGKAFAYRGYYFRNQFLYGANDESQT